MEANYTEPFFTSYKLWWWWVYSAMGAGTGLIAYVLLDTIKHVGRNAGLF
jgi:hypothetical protein